MQNMPLLAECQALNFEVVLSPRRAREVIAAIKKSGKNHALDFEATSLYPRDGVIRLTNIYGPVFSGIFDHYHCGSFESLADEMAECPAWIVYPAMFEGRWFDAATEDKTVELWDVGLMSKAKLGGNGYTSLAVMAKRDLGVILDKTEQTSDWSRPQLSAEQYQYAMDDAKITYKLFQFWVNELDDDQWDAFFILNDAWRGSYEMEDCGILLDEEYHCWLIGILERRRDAAIRVLRKYTPEDVIPNLNSKKQLSDFLKTVLDEQAIRAWPKTSKKEQLKTDKEVLRSASFRAPYPLSRWLAALMVYNRAFKYLSSYGEKLITMQQMQGRVKSRLNMAQAVTGRFSSFLQTIPRSPLVRRSFVAPKGAILVMADYEGIELRVLGEESGDENLLHDVIYSNPHAASAAQLFNLDFEQVMARLVAKDPVIKALRSKAKSFSFQLTYGAGTGALAIVMRCSDDEARDFVNKWAAKYPKAYHYRTIQYENMKYNKGFIRLRSGRTILVPREDRTLPVASNYPIQGSAADVMYRAIYHCERMLRAAWKSMGLVANMCFTVHDELLLLCTPEWVEETKAILEEAMKLGWLDIYPGTSTDNLVKAEAGQSWAEKG